MPKPKKVVERTASKATSTTSPYPEEWGTHRLPRCYHHRLRT